MTFKCVFFVLWKTLTNKKKKNPSNDITFKFPLAEK